MTKNEAKTKWCPFGRLADTANRIAGYNRYQNIANHAQSRCIASECMAWREDEYRGGAGEGKGYCGLAGKP